MRELVDVGCNSLTISDAISGQKIVLNYRMPTSEERVAFNKACITKGGDRVVFDSNPARQEFGLLILVGFQAGAFSVKGKPISSDSQDAAYLEGWKDLVGDTASDLVAALAMVVFEGTRVAAPESVDLGSTGGPEDKGTAAGEKIAPLSKPSGD